MKKLITLLLIAVLCIASVPATANAAVKISKKNITLEVDKTTTLKVTGTTKGVKWTSNNKEIATVTSGGKVTAVAVGEATITATVSKKKYTCKVTVTNGFNAKKASENIDGEFTDLGTDVIGIFTNNNKYPIHLTITAIFYGSDGSMLGKSSNDNYYFEAGKQCAYSFMGPLDNDYNRVSYSSYKISYSADDILTKKSAVSDIKTESNIGSDNVMVKVVNSSKIEPTSTQISVVFYKEGKVIGSDYHYAEIEDTGSEDYLEFSFPYDKEYNSIQIDNYEVFVNSSFRYDWE